MAGRALIAQAPRPVALRTGQAELHRARCLRHTSAAVTFRTDRIRARPRPCPIARRARFLARDVEPDLFPFDGLPEIDAQPVFEIRSRFRRSCARIGRLAPSKPLAENVLKIRRAFRGCATSPAALALRKIKSPETHVGASLPARAARATLRHSVFRIEAVLIVHGFLL